jgi:FkbM family methyltransferase
MLGGRPLSMVLREALRPRNYAAVARMARVCPDFRETAPRYLLGTGAYPYACRLRTPVGVVAPTLYSSHDMITVNEVFCRRDYPAGAEVRTVVDVGSNIGVSALWFLTRNTESRCWLHEPVPRNVERLRRNLADFAGRWDVREAAVGEAPGRARFGTEPSGRYGGIGRDIGEWLDVECLGVNDVLEEALAAAPAIDLLKIDTEGTELAILEAIRPELLARVRTVCLELQEHPGELPEGFDGDFRNETLVLRNRAAALPWTA